MASFNLISDLISKSGSILRNGGLGLQHMNFGEGRKGQSI